MEIVILTLFPEMFSVLQHSIIGKAVESGSINLKLINIRDYTTNKHKKCDDYPFGGGDGMVMSIQPIYDAVNDVDPDHKLHRIFMSPQGTVLSQNEVIRLSELNLAGIMLLCGHYEGVDKRAIELLFDEEISIGDYILTGGELAAMVVVDSVSRYVDGVLGSHNSTTEESFCLDGLLEYPQYTRPEDFLGHKVPAILLSGNHGKVKEWRHQQSVEITRQKRPDLYEKYMEKQRIIEQNNPKKNKKRRRSSAEITQEID